MLKHGAIKEITWIQVVVWTVRTERSSFRLFLIPVHGTGPKSTPLRQEQPDSYCSLFSLDLSPFLWTCSSTYLCALQ